MNINPYARTILLYLLAGLVEIDGGWLMWQWLREGKNIWWAIVGHFVDGC